jgi:hypothetical protein
MPREIPLKPDLPATKDTKGTYKDNRRRPRRRAFFAIAAVGALAAAWPPLRATGQPTVGNGVNASIISSTARSDGNPQITDNGHPLYLYVGDQKAGDTNGQGVTAFGGGWFALSPAGDQIAAQGSSSGGGSGY